MNSRQTISLILVSLGIILALLPLTGSRSFTSSPDRVLSGITDEKSWLTVDQVARIVASEDTAWQLIDLRSPEEFSHLNIPGSLNIPYDKFISIAPGTMTGNTRYILYSNGDIDANSAYVLASGMNIRNVHVMKGGLNEWFRIVINSRFSGERITARENALYENRRKASMAFTELNSLPDSLKRKYYEARHVSAKKLDGGCE